MSSSQTLPPEPPPAQDPAAAKTLANAQAERPELSALKARLGGIKTEDSPALVKQKSRDFHWYSPMRKASWAAAAGDLVVTPANEAELLRVLAAAAELAVPVTARGGGTGTRGGAMPLAGGIVLDLSGLNRIVAVQRGRIVAEAGAVIADLDRAARPQGQELRIHPTTYATATVGGFVAAGTGGIGSVTWGRLQDAGNVIAVKLATLEETPRILSLRGDELEKVVGADGVTGIITEVELPLGPAYPWVDVMLGFDTLERAAALAETLAHADGIAKKNIAVIAAPGGETYFPRHVEYVAPGNHLVIAIVADFALDATLALAASAGAEVLLRSDTLGDEEREKLPPAFELTWSHATLRALRVDPAVSAIEALLAGPGAIATALALDARFAGQVVSHLELIRVAGKVTCMSMPLVLNADATALGAVAGAYREAGAIVIDDGTTAPSTRHLAASAAQAAFRREADPRGLLARTPPAATAEAPEPVPPASA